jgi:predicted permease
LQTLSTSHVALSPDQVRTPAPTVAVGAHAKSAQPGIHNRTVLLYLFLALLILVPGMVLRVGVDTGVLKAWGLGELTTYLDALQKELQDIQFGSGVRFWLGVGGTTILGLLLLYPVRKVLANRRGVGSVGSWFHLHILLGIAGPVLILYHSNFGHGSLNANVALWTMLLVSVSGIIGYFVYARVSANFYNSRQQAQTHRNAVLAVIPDSAAFQTRKDLLISKFEAFEAELLTPRQGLMASIRARLRLERHRREIASDVSGLVVDAARSRGDTAPVFQQFRSMVGQHLRAYFGIARAAASQSVSEQLWSRWRLLHMPVFLIMIVAVILHVIAVWDRGEPAMTEADQAGVTVVAGARSEQLATVSKQQADQPVARAAAAVAPQQTEPTSPASSPIRVLKRPIVATRPTTDVASKPANDALVPPAPQLARRPIVRPSTQMAAVDDGKTVEIKAPEPKPAPVLVPVPVAEARRIEPPTMGLGGNPGAFKPSSLDEMFAAFKAKQQAGEFSHSDIETGFGLTGKHLKIECASCHNKPLPATRQNTAARTCLSCHEKDDNHSGRRPDCAKCHTTNRWKQRIR